MKKKKPKRLQKKPGSSGKSAKTGKQAKAGRARRDDTRIPYPVKVSLNFSSGANVLIDIMEIDPSVTTITTFWNHSPIYEASAPTDPQLHALQAPHEPGSEGNRIDVAFRVPPGKGPPIVVRSAKGIKATKKKVQKLNLS